MKEEKTDNVKLTIGALLFILGIMDIVSLFYDIRWWTELISDNIFFVGVNIIASFALILTGFIMIISCFDEA